MTKTRIQRLAALLLLSFSTPLLLSCSGSDESNLDVLAEWRKNAPSTSTPAPAAGDTESLLPTIPEGADPYSEENYRLAAIRSYMLARGYVMDLLTYAGEFDLLNKAWVSSIEELADKYVAEVEHFSKLNPPAEYQIQHAKILESMQKILDQIDYFNTAMRDGNFVDGADSIAVIQAEANTMVKNGRFDEEAGFTPTTVPAP